MGENANGVPSRNDDSGPPTVFVTAGRREARRRISSVLAAHGIEVSKDAATPEELPRVEHRTPATVVVFSGETATSAGAVRLARRRMPAALIVLVVRRDASGRALPAAIRSRVEAVVYLDQIQSALMPTVRAVLAEQVVFPRPERRRFETPHLSYRERQVVGFAVVGYTNDAIARRLHLATSTVKSHLTSAFSKLGVRSRSEAATLLLDPEEPIGQLVLAAAGGKPPSPPWE